MSTESEATTSFATTNHEMDQENYATQQGSPDRSTHDDDIETKRSMFTRLREMLVRTFLPKCFVYPFLAVVVVVVTVVMIVQYLKGDDNEITQVIIKDYTDTNTTTLAPSTTSANASFSSPSPSETPT